MGLCMSVIMGSLGPFNLSIFCFKYEQRTLKELPPTQKKFQFYKISVISVIISLAKMDFEDSYLFMLVYIFPVSSKLKHTYITRIFKT